MKSSLTPRVFPDPVCAMPTLSSPERATGHIRDWMGVGLQIPCLARTSLISSAQNVKPLHYSIFKSTETKTDTFSQFLITLFRIKQLKYVCVFDQNTWKIDMLHIKHRSRNITKHFYIVFLVKCFYFFLNKKKIKIWHTVTL